MNGSVFTRLLLLLQLMLYCAPSSLLAAEAAPTAENPELEARMLRVAEELRCLVCQNQTIADSNAELAKDLRREVRQMLAQGKSEAEVREFMVARYGDFILYRPPLNTSTLLLWAGPFALLLVAFWIYRRVVRGRNSSVTTERLSDAEQQRLQALLGADSSSRRG